MPEIQFQNQGEEFGRPPQERAGFDLTGKMVSSGLVSSRKEAEYALIGIAGFLVLVALYFGYKAISGGGAPPPPPVSLAASVLVV